MKRSISRLRAQSPLVCSLGLLGLFAVSTACAGKKLEGQVLGTQSRIQEAIGNGSKAIGCAPKETALSEANIKFAEEALMMGEYYRGKEHANLAAKYTEIAELKTDPVRCRAPGQVVAKAEPTAKDKDGDGYDDDVDGCPDNPEDFDGFEDEDGCPDEDNDKDTVKDAAELIDGVWSNNDQKDGVDCRNDPEDADGFEDEDGCPDPDNDKDGLIDHPELIDKCPNEPEDFDKFEDEDGCPDPDNDKDGFLDGVDACPMEPEDVDGDQDTDGCPDLAAKIDPCAIRVDGKIMFDSNKHDLESKKFKDSNYKLLDDVVAVLNNNPDVTIEVGGHTDSKSSDSYNLKLSQRRVDSVRQYLINKGIKDSRVTAVGYGEKVPVDTNKTKEGRENNRRVEFNRTDNPECNKP